MCSRCSSNSIISSARKAVLGGEQERTTSEWWVLKGRLDVNSSSIGSDAKASETTNRDSSISTDKDEELGLGWGTVGRVEVQFELLPAELAKLRPGTLL